MACCCQDLTPGACCTPRVTQLLVTVSGLSTNGGPANSCENFNGTYVYDILPTDCLTESNAVLPPGGLSLPSGTSLSLTTRYQVQAAQNRIRILVSAAVSQSIAPRMFIAINRGEFFIPYDAVLRECRNSAYLGSVSWSVEYGANPLPECSVGGASLVVTIQ